MMIIIIFITISQPRCAGHPNPVPDFPASHPLERNYSPHPGYPNMPSTGLLISSFFMRNPNFVSFPGLEPAAGQEPPKDLYWPTF